MSASGMSPSCLDMSNTVTIPQGATEQERRRLRQEVERVHRNARIRDAYPSLRDELGWRRAM